MTTIATLKKNIIPILKRQDVVKAAVFGSCARGEMKKGSDIDLLVQFAGRKSLFDLVGLELELKKILKKKVDVLTYNSIHPLLRDIILNEQKVIYEKKS
jgi:predicted nucleotidyltransferase